MTNSINVPPPAAVRFSGFFAPLCNLRWQTAFHRCYAILTSLLMAWCLFWPIYARKLDLEAISKEVRETYKICLQQPGVSQKDCANDRDFSRNFQRKLIAPPDKNPYQSFVGSGSLAMIFTLTALCIVPPLLLYGVFRFLGAIIRALWRSAPRTAPIHRYLH